MNCPSCDKPLEESKESYTPLYCRICKFQVDKLASSNTFYYDKFIDEYQVQWFGQKDNWTHVCVFVVDDPGEEFFLFKKLPYDITKEQLQKLLVLI